MDESFLKKLSAERQRHGSTFPRGRDAEALASALLEFLFPHFSHAAGTSVEGLEQERKAIEATLYAMLNAVHDEGEAWAASITEQFLGSLPRLYDLLRMDADAIFAGDPAARTVDEVIVTYPGFFAIAIYRFAHEFFKAGVPLLPRMLTEYAHQRTGIDIHPGAVIGHSFCIDHGTGIVVGETSSIGHHVKMYQGVTLGGLSVSKDRAGKKRHPTIEDRVVLYANATILGGDTVVGHDSVIGGNVWITKSVPPHSYAYHQSEVAIRPGKLNQESEE